MDSLVSVVIDVVHHAANKGWGQPPKLYSLARKATITSSAPAATFILSGEQDNALISIEQDPLPPGDPEDVIADIHWHDEVEGCVLVTELLVLPPGTEGKAPDEPTAAEQWAASRPDHKEARLAVGVLRDGSHVCCLQLKGDNELILAPDLAEDLVTALLATFAPIDTADQESSPPDG